MSAQLEPIGRHDVQAAEIHVEEERGSGETLPHSGCRSCLSIPSSNFFDLSCQIFLTFAIFLALGKHGRSRQLPVDTAHDCKDF